MEQEHKGAFLASGCLILTAVIWGAGFIVTRAALDAGFSSGYIMLLRFAISAVAMLLCFRRSLFPLEAREVRIGLVAGAILFAAFYGQVLGLSLTKPSNSGFLTALNVILVPFLAWALYRRRPPARVFFACALALGGIFVLTYNGQGFTFNLGDLCTVLCALFFACHIVWVGFCAGRVSPEKLSFLQMFFAFLFSIPVFLLFDLEAAAQANFAAGLPAVLFLGLFSTCLGFFLQTFAQNRVSSGRAAVILCTESLWCSVFSVAFGYEPLTGQIAAGGLMVLGSVLVVETDLGKLFYKNA